MDMLSNLYCGTKNVAIYVCSSGKFPEYGKYACVKDLTNIMSGPPPPPFPFFEKINIHILGEFITFIGNS